MNSNITLGGQSFILNAIFIGLNLIGLTLITMGFHDNFLTNKTLLLSFGFGLLILSIAAIIIFKGRLFISFVSRILVGSLFIVSGLIKANDPVGFSYKLEEYFEDGALAYRIKEWFGVPGFSLEFLIEWALVLSVVICIIEIILGVLVLIGGKIKLVSWLLMLMMLFFTFLTWHTANCDPNVKYLDHDTYLMSDPLSSIKIQEAKTNTALKIISRNSDEVVIAEKKQPQCVTDCGCFGDAMKGSLGRSLTPKESLWKDIILVYLVFWIFITQYIIKPNTGKENRYVVPISLGLILFLSFVFGWYFPFLFGILSIFGALWILKAGGSYLGNYSGSTLLVLLLCTAMTTYVLMFEPIKDYRPYAMGSNLYQKMNDGKEGVYESGFMLKNLKTGKLEFFTQSEYTDTVRKIWEDKNYKYVSTDTKEIIPTKLPSITSQFNPIVEIDQVTEAELSLDYVKSKVSGKKQAGVLLFDKENDSEIEVLKSEYNDSDYDTSSYTFVKDIEISTVEETEISIRDYILKEKQVIIIFSKNLADFNDKEKIKKFKEIFDKASSNEIPMLLVCSSARNQVNYWRKKNKFNIPTFINDETELKAVSRSNPCMIVLQKGVVVGKYPHRSLPSYEWLKKHILK